MKLVTRWMVVPMVLLGGALAPAALAAAPRPVVAPPAAGAQAPGGALSVQLAVTDDRPDTDETIAYVVRVTNGGAAVRNATVELTLAPSFLLEQTVPPAPGCTPGLALNVVTCSLGGLAQGASRELYVMGQYGSNGSATLTATARGGVGAAQVGPGGTASLTIEVEDSDGDGDKGDDGGADGGGDRACPGGNLVLSGGTSPNDDISVDDDLELRLNGSTFFNDNDENAQDLPPIPVPGGRGDRLRVIASDSVIFGGPEQIDPLYLHCLSTGDRQVLDAQGVPSADNVAGGQVFYDETFTIKFSTGGQSSLPTRQQVDEEEPTEADDESSGDGDSESSGEDESTEEGDADEGDGSSDEGEGSTGEPTGTE